MKTKEEIKKGLAFQYFGKEAENYDYLRSEDPRRNFIIKIQEDITRDFLKDIKSKKRKILDVACGTGRFFYLYSPMEIYGIDISLDMLEKAKNRKGVHIKKILVADAEKIPFKDNFFDVVNTSQFIMHTPYYDKIIKEMARVTKKGGSIIIDFPNKKSISSFFTKKRVLTGKFRHYNLFDKKEIFEIAKKNNLKIKSIKETVFFSPMFLPKCMLKSYKKLNDFLIKTYPNFSYVFYFHFVKE